MFQSGIARLLSVNHTPDSDLAGGAALHIEPNGKRFSNDLDYFNDSEERVATAFEQDRALLASEGYGVDIVLSLPAFFRAIVTGSGDETKVEWSHDSAWRFLPTMRSEACGYQLHPIDRVTERESRVGWDATGRASSREQFACPQPRREVPGGEDVVAVFTVP